jgi:5-methylcytosine-specific restriction endonuclease McrA
MKKCLACDNLVEKITKDHVIPRVVLRDAMGITRYAKFCTAARKINLQPMCADCNGRKGSRVIDYRNQFLNDQLRALVKQWGLDITFEDSKAAVL